MSVADDLQALTERINPLIDRAEKAILALGLEFEAEIDLGPGKKLAWTRIRGEWRLCVLPTLRPLRSESRQTRLEALTLLPRLMEEIRAVAKSAPEAILIVELAKQFLDDLESRTSR